jgi:hypothetical protein
MSAREGMTYVREEGDCQVYERDACKSTVYFFNGVEQKEWYDAVPDGMNLLHCTCVKCKVPFYEYSRSVGMHVRVVDYQTCRRCEEEVCCNKCTKARGGRYCCASCRPAKRQ